MSIKKSLLLAALLFHLSIPVALAETFLIIDHAECAKPATDGGWGGSCEAHFTDGDVFSTEIVSGSNGCDNDTEKPVGLCGDVDGVDSGLRESCCVAKSSTARGKSLGQFMEEETTCTGSAIGGTCQANMCDSATQDYIGICEDTVSDDYCCTPKGQTPTPAATGAVVGATDGVGNHGGTAPQIGNISVATNYTPLEKVPFIDGASFSEYLSGVYILGLVLVVIGAVFMLVIGGFQYLTSAGNTSALSSAKHTIEGALFGLVLALVSYIILNTINPDLVNVNISTLQPLATRSGNGSVSNYGGPGSVTVPPGTKGCYDCVTVTTIPCKSSSSCQLNRTFLAKLEAANTQLKDITITEAWPPTVVHQSACHSNGTCADIRSNPTDVANMVRYYKALSSAGLGGSFLEVGKGGSCTPYTTNAVPCIITKGTGYHFHVR